MPNKDFQVSIIGGGIGGLTLAIGLLDKGIDVTIFEAASKFAEIGAGIAIGPNAQNALKRLGLYQDFLKFAEFPDRNLFFQWRLGTGEEQTMLSETTCKEYGMASIHRAEMLDTFVKRIPENRCRFGKRIKEIIQDRQHSQSEHRDQPQDDRIQLVFEDGSTHFTDLVIGCDGIHSKVRGALNAATAGESAVAGSEKLVWSGSWAYRGLIPKERFVEAVGSKNGEFYAKTAQMFLAKDRHILIFPIKGGSVVNLVAFNTDRSRWPQRTPLIPRNQPWIQETSQQEMLDDFQDFGTEIVNMLKCIEKPSKWALHQMIPPLNSYINKRVLVTGDAAHGGTPHQGAMAGQAIEDALFVSRLLAHPSVNKSNLEKALGAVDAIRVPRANKVLVTSLEAGDAYEFAGPLGDDLEKLGQHLVTRFDHIWEYDLDDEANRLEAWLRDNL